MKENIFAVRESVIGVMTVHVATCGVKGFPRNETIADALIAPTTSVSGVDALKSHPRQSETRARRL